MKQRNTLIPAILNCALVLALVSTAAVAAVEHVVTGTVKDIDRAGHKVIVETADGTEATFRLGGRAAGHMPSDVAKGSHVVVRSTGESAEKTIVSIAKLGEETPHAAKGTVVGADKAVGSVVIETDKGARETFHLAGRGFFDSGKGVERASARSIRTGEHVSVEYTERGGRKVAHVFRRIV